MICPAIAIESRTSARKTQSWKATWCAPIDASPNRVGDGSGEDERGDERRRPYEDPLAEREHAPGQGQLGTRLSTREPAQDHDDEHRSHQELRDRGPPGRALDPPVEPVHEEHLEDDVHDVPGDDDQKRRAQIGDPSQVALAAEREERGRQPDGGDPEVRDGVLRRVALASHQRDERLREHRDERGDADAEADGEPHRLRAEPPRRLLLARSARARHLRGRPVLEEVEDREDAAEDRRGDAERGELRAAEVPDDRGVDEEVQRLRGERAERRHREPEDLAVVRRPEPHADLLGDPPGRLDPLVTTCNLPPEPKVAARNRKLQVVTSGLSARFCSGCVDTASRARAHRAPVGWCGTRGGGYHAGGVASIVASYAAT